jgi:hypothetical protein
MKFFILINPKAGDGDAVTDFIPLKSSPLGRAPQCISCERFIGMMPLVPPIRLKLQLWGDRWGDIAFGPGDQILVSAKLEMLFVGAGMTGFERFDASTITGVKKPRHVKDGPPHYKLATIRLGKAAVADIPSGLIRENSTTCRECHNDGLIKRADCIVIEPGTWSGEDVFFARGLPGVIVVSERFKSLCDANALANCRLMKAGDFSFDYYPWEKPHRSLNSSPQAP